MSLADYQITYSGNPYGADPGPKTFGELGVTAARVVMQAGGLDSMEITVDASVYAAGMPLLPFARHDLRNPQGVLVFSGWLMEPTRRATPGKHQQTYRLEGPMCRLGAIPYRQPWYFALYPDLVSSATAPYPLAKVILNLEDFDTGTRVPVKAQVQQILEYAKAHGAPIDYLPSDTANGLDAIPDAQPPEDEQSDVNVADVLKRQMRWVPKVSPWWQYGSGTPTLAFTAADPASADDIAAAVGGPRLPVGTPYLIMAGGAGLVIDLLSERIVGFETEARYDLLVGVLQIDYLSEQLAVEGAARRLWYRMGSEVSPVGGEAVNGSFLEISCTIELRGASTLEDDYGVPLVPGEQQPTNVAEALHAPFSVLTYSVGWSTVAADVEWETRPGMAVSVLNGGDQHPVTARSILQTIMRDLGSGTTTYKAGPPTQLGINDLLSLLRVTRLLNQGRNGTANGGYNQGGGPAGQQYGFKDPNQGKTGSGGGGGGGDGIAFGTLVLDASIDGEIKSVTVDGVINS